MKLVFSISVPFIGMALYLGAVLFLKVGWQVRESLDWLVLIGASAFGATLVAYQRTYRAVPRAAVWTLSFAAFIGTVFVFTFALWSLLTGGDSL